MLCAFMCQLINLAETLVQLGSFPLLPGVSPAPLDLCVADRSPRCSSAQKTACVCTFFSFSPSLAPVLSRSLTAATWASTYTAAAQVAVQLQSPGIARRLFDRLRRPSPTNLAALSRWRAMKTSVHKNNRLSRAMETCKPRRPALSCWRWWWCWWWWGVFL